MQRLLPLLARIHDRGVHRRRVAVLAGVIAPLLPPGSHIIDVGCGDGALAAAVARSKPGSTVEGFDIACRPAAHIPVRLFDGLRLPLPNQSCDVVLLIDVLHHTPDPLVLLAEAARVARRAIIIKDHRLARPDARLILRVMDWISNRPHGVPLPCNYWPEERWRQAWDELGLRVDHYQDRLGLYPWPANWLFEKGLHFWALLRPPTARV